jgi:hypothetical protein
MLTQRDLKLASAWLRARLPGANRRAQRQEEPLLGQLFSARDRARRRQQSRSQENETTPPPAAVERGSSANQTSQEAQPAENKERPETGEKPPESQADSLERLRAAKKRARRE